MGAVLPVYSSLEPLNLATRPDAELLAKLSHSSAIRLGAIPIRREGDEVIVAMLDVDDIFAIDELQQKLGTTVRAQPCEPELLETMLQKVYRRSDEMRQIAKALEHELEERANQEDGLNSVMEQAEVAPVMQLLQNIFADALELGSSDIHLEPEADGFRIRQRVDGFLQEQRVDNPIIFPALAIRLKLMADLDIAEKRLPQEGRFLMPLLDQDVEVRIATMPTLQGESISLRLIVKSLHQRDLTSLGLGSAQLAQLEKILADPHGMILVVGPTGSGKSTTLTSMLQKLNTPEIKIFTIEDPIETNLSGVTQVQVNSKIGLNFSDVLRSSLRHDPDVIMLGEMRDGETAQIAVRAAMTGHLVFSTMHCNDARSAVPRLLDMGVESYLLNGSLRAVVAQRLLRKVCKFCAQPALLSPIDKQWIRELGVSTGETFVKGSGCGHCAGTGYRGRIGIYEVLEMGKPHLEMAAGNTSDSANAAAKKSLLMSGLNKAINKETTLSEIKRVLGTSERKN